MNDILAILTFVGAAVGRVWPAFLISVALGVLVRALKLDGIIHQVFNRRVGWAIILVGEKVTSLQFRCRITALMSS